ncbi:MULTISPECIES: TrkA C-terminal domain-containing protein [Bacillaceae]|uniref:TrkA C-terminal domain-containing protein n=1 Tax=Bacillaceae TaxID=186817 RepID=UPI000B9A59DD|nr:TrkA C-terminal domain-containing protein [Bacillus infantis]MCA1035573.1 TrkA C-terminal domain-containing protein [Bacillus infantis]MDW2878274.1 TrkA C-terminal domain-containing protein [Bacillus infantis]OXT17714.1 hypothetical protein B9K06_10435 [Bacillus sp. OG2]
MAYLFIFIYIIIILAVIEISALLFIYTGLDKQIARFQVISMMTGTGFTTGESELILEHPLRRKICAFLILFGAFSLAVIISSISSILSEEFLTKEVGYIAAGLILIILILKMPSVKNKFIDWLKHDVEEHYDFTDLPIKDVLLTNEEDYILKYPVLEDSPFAGKKLSEIIDPEKDDVVVLYVSRGEITIRKECLSTEIQEGDDIVVYGDEKTIKKTFGDDSEGKEVKKEG